MWYIYVVCIYRGASLGDAEINILEWNGVQSSALQYIMTVRLHIRCRSRMSDLSLIKFMFYMFSLTFIYWATGSRSSHI